MHIRQAKVSDLDAIMNVIDAGRTKMRENGNTSQWGNGYPGEKDILNDIYHQQSYVVEEENNNHDLIVGTFCLQLGQDPTYNYIEDGDWLNDDEYVTIHRISSAKESKGVMSEVLDWVSKAHSNVRIDTHKSNTAMIHILEKEGYSHCGTIYVSDGTPRLAFHRFYEGV